ncbi:NAD(+)/NADH kinase [Streptomyces sp. ML-6]|uniref:NAD(+)/NADH kinase n=1 Tax=Streptomyces sp. ML-6 TaxID=2982693 RepID=UPI0024BF8C31|nr:NAD(+)/NADH kinase [Streptomyces sp. ML-6]MDK0523789.1 NAD(+)/NADH kinase [Streptomyces sp. ML-6]
MGVERVGVVVHQGHPEAVVASEVVRDWCAREGIPCTDIDVWRDDARRRGGREEADVAGNPDLVVTLGGDGTFLRGARIAAKNGGAVLGVDLGRVGFLTEVPAGEVVRALDAVHRDRAEVEQRMTLTMRASRALEVPPDIDALMAYGQRPVLPPPQIAPGEEATAEGWGVALDVTALNDVVVEKLARDRQVSLGVYIGGRLLASYSADAVIMATPTGSTAYSFAAGGPVVSPRMDAVLFTPVAAHMTFDRTVVAAADEPVAVRILPHSGQAAVTIDGQLRGVLGAGDWLGVYAAPRRLRVVRLGPNDFYGRLRTRLRLTDAPATAADGESAPLFRPDGPVPHDLAHLHLSPADRD